jgi:hypothetical protein
MSISNSRDFIHEVKRHPERFYIIHYSCQSLYDDNDELSPRITSIAITHFATEQTISFSTHAIAEILHVNRDNVGVNFNIIETELLKQFYGFVRDRREMFWIHWNMRNLTYGFEHIEHRFRILCETDPPVIPVERRINLNEMLKDRYGSDYVKDPKMTTLMELNGGIHRHFLKGPEEVDAFKKLEFIRMHNSTLCKVGFFYLVIQKLISGELNTTSHGWGTRLDRLFESRTAKLIGLISSVIGILSLIFIFA